MLTESDRSLPASGMTQDPPRQKVLIVEDFPPNLDLLCMILAEHGYEPRPVSSGTLALEAARTSPPDLILLDVNMPGMNGWEVCERLKTDPNLKDIPIIFITALAETEDKVKAFSLGAVDYVTKPFQVREILARVETHLMIRALQCRLADHNKNLERLVAKRTLELARANERLVEMGRLKDDFLLMISHELRTPANGILGISELLLDLCPASEERTEYALHLERGSRRLRNLIEDATLIAGKENLTEDNTLAVSFMEILKEVSVSLPDIEISIDAGTSLESVFLLGNPSFLQRAMETMILLAASFSKERQRVRGTGIVKEQSLHVYLHLDALSLSVEAIDSFFEMESLVRGSSTAEALGLAPVVAHRILSALGGDMVLFKGEGDGGSLNARFPLVGGSTQKGLAQS